MRPGSMVVGLVKMIGDDDDDADAAGDDDDCVDGKG